MILPRTISGRLLETLLRGRKRIGDRAAEIISQYVASRQGAGGGFAGNGGTEDIYYTLFGWMLSWTLGMRLDSRRMASYLDGLDPEGMDLVHYAAFTRCAMLQKLVAGGLVGVLKYLMPRSSMPGPPASAQAPGGDPLSPYSRFVSLSLTEDSGHRTKDAAKIMDDLQAYRVPSGGYANMRGAAEATVNATAAAMIVQGQSEGYRRGTDSLWLRERQHPSGGFGAVAGAPVPDLLSTATALFTLRMYGEEPKFSASGFIEGHWLDGGGFAATLLDDRSDVEYTFYGLLALGAL